jgi:xanthine/CO dehydrogenase XdhC/CoxF family maturation factor
MSPLRLDTSLEALLARLRQITGPAALATIVSTMGSTYRKAGARMLIESDGRITGLLSGGCLEADLAERAQKVLATNTPAIVEYDMRTEDDLIFGIGAGCEGAMRILIEPLPADGTLAVGLSQACAESHAGQPAAIAIVHRGDEKLVGTWVYRPDQGQPMPAELAHMCADMLAKKTTTSGPFVNDGVTCEAWIQFLAAVPQILVCGAGPDAIPLVNLLTGLGLPVTVTDHRPHYVTSTRLPTATLSLGPANSLAMRLKLNNYFAAIVMSHHLASDSDYLSALATSSIPYIGALGPRMRRERLLSGLGEHGHLLAPRLHGPVGLDIGAVTPEAIALAIAAEIHAAAAQRLSLTLGPSTSPPV